MLREGWCCIFERVSGLTHFGVVEWTVAKLRFFFKFRHMRKSPEEWPQLLLLILSSTGVIQIRITLQHVSQLVCGWMFLAMEFCFSRLWRVGDAGFVSCPMTADIFFVEWDCSQQHTCALFEQDILWCILGPFNIPSTQSAKLGYTRR